MKKPAAKPLAFAFAALSAACSFSDQAGLEGPEVRAGVKGDLPSVVDLRYSDSCAGEEISFTLGFSHPMDRANVESAIAIAEVRGDIRGETLPLGDPPAEIVRQSFQWDNGDRNVTFSAILKSDTQYVLDLPQTVTSKSGNGLDGQVGADLDGDGNRDVREDAANLARLDNDYLRTPSPFRSLPFFRCSSEKAPSIWRTPRNQARPRVLEFVGLKPSNDLIPRYIPEAGLFRFSEQDGMTLVDKPLPSTGVLRFQAATPNTAPSGAYAFRNLPAPVLPSTLAGNFEVVDDGLKDYNAKVYLDERLQVPGPLTGNIDTVTADNKFTSDPLAGIPADALAGMWLITENENNLIYMLRIAGNNAGGELTLDPDYYVGLHVLRETNRSDLTFTGGMFRENELRGMKVARINSVDTEVLVAEGNTATFVRIQSGLSNCPPYSSYICNYAVRISLAGMGLEGRRFEIVPEHLFVTTDARRDGQKFRLRLNIGDNPITDVFGRPFVDGNADGDDLRAVADDVWEGVFTSGDVDSAPIPPRLQLNDSRYYSPFPGGATSAASVELGGHGRFTNLGNGVMGQYRAVCRSGGVAPELYALGLLFATPDALQHGYGSEDLLSASSLNNSNFGLYRMHGLEPEPLPLTVNSATVQHDFFLGSTFLLRQPATLVLLTPGPSGGTVTLAGDDELCGSGDDKNVEAARPWQAGDRLLISHRVQYPASDENSLDGNYDGILSNDADDDIIFEYHPAGEERFVPLR